MIDLLAALDFMASTQGLRLPHGILFQSYEAVTSEEEWDNFGWNDPSTFDENHVESDPRASPKPRWGDLLTANRDFEFSSKRNSLLARLDQITTRRIAILYHPSADRQPEKEWQVRLSGADTLEQDNERLRLVRRHNEIKERIENATSVTTLNTIQRILDSDALWTSGVFPDTFPS